MEQSVLIATIFQDRVSSPCQGHISILLVDFPPLALKEDVSTALY